MIGVASPEYQLSVGNLGEFVTRLSSAVLTSGDIVSVYTRGNLGAVVRVFDPETGTVTQTTLFGASSVSPELWGFTGMDLVALAGGGFAVFGRAVNTSNGATPAVWLFDATGVQVGTPVRVLGASAANVTMHATDSGFLLTWSDRTAGVDQAFVQAFTAAGAPIGSPQFVGQVVDKEMDVVELSNGRMALAWTTTFGTMELAELNANGVLTGVRVTADNSTSAPFGWSMGPKLVADGNGFLSLHIDDGLVLTRFSAGFVQQGSAVRVQAAYPGTGDFGGYPKYNQNESTHDIAVLPNGVIVIAYAGYDAGAATVGNVYIRYLAPDGTPLTDPITANARVPDDQRAVTLLTMPDGRIFLSFIDDTNGIFGAQQYAQGVWLDGPDGYFVGDADADTANGGTGDDAMLGNGGNDTLGGLGGDDQVSGGDGDDSLNGGDGEDQVNGGSGNDVMSGDNGDDIVLGGAGNDTGSGGEGLDVVSGQDGNDLLSGNRRDDVLYGGADDDTLDGGSGSDVVEGGDGVDSLYGDGSADTLKGGAGNDRIDGGSGKDSMDGDLGDDLLLGQKGDDAMYGGDGNDTIRGGTENDIVNGGRNDDNLDGGEGNDILAGQSGLDRLLGGDANDILYGGQDNDTLEGGAGNDTLYAASGNDRLIGGFGKDVFDFGFTFSEGAIGQDVIDDFQVGSDRIVINLWGLEFGVTLTLEERPRGSSALVTATGDEILLRGVSVTEFSVADLQI